MTQFLKYLNLTKDKKMANRFTQAAEQARQITNDQLANEITSICSLNMEKVNELMPAKEDKEAFLALMKEVQSETTMDQKQLVDKCPPRTTVD